MLIFEFLDWKKDNVSVKFLQETEAGGYLSIYVCIYR